MSDEVRPEEELTPAEERLVRLLLLLAAEAPRNGASLPETVVRTARWQLALRGVMQAIGDVGFALVEGLSLLLGVRNGSRRG